MNYEAASDFEINKAVAEALGYKVIRRTSYTGRFMEVEPDSVWHTKTNHEHREHQDWCNNPSDAWPIIIENKISIKSYANSCTWGASQHHVIVKSNCSQGHNPLRAAMIVFLKMKESE